MTSDSGRHSKSGDAKWLPIAEYVGTYSVSSDGRVFSHLCDRELAPVLNSSGYATVKLRSRRHRIHRLVCEAFNGRGNALHRHVAHLNGDRADNRAENLKWVSPAENDSHKDRHGTRQAGAKHPRRKLTQEQVDEIRSSPETGAALARRFGVNKEAVSKVRLGQRWRCQSVIAQTLSPSNHKDPSTMTTHKDTLLELTDRARRRRHCSKCELPQIICACAEAAAYDKAHPFLPKPAKAAQ